MKRINANIIIMGLSTLFALSSCRKDNDQVIVQPNNQKVSSFLDLKVPTTFDWKTSKAIQVNFTPKSKGVITAMDSDANVYYKAIVNANENHSFTLTTAAAQENLFLYFRGQEEKINLKGTNDFNSNLK